MYNTKLNEVFTDKVVQDILLMVAGQCEEKNIQCLVYCDETETLPLLNGKRATFPGLMLCKDVNVMQDIFANYEATCMSIIEQSAEMCFTALAPITEGDPYNVQKESLQIWVQ